MDAYARFGRRGSLGSVAVNASCFGGVIGTASTSIPRVVWHSTRTGVGHASDWRTDGYGSGVSNNGDEGAISMRVLIPHVHDAQAWARASIFYAVTHGSWAILMLKNAPKVRHVEVEAVGSTRPTRTARVGVINAYATVGEAPTAIPSVANDVSTSGHT